MSRISVDVSSARIPVLQVGYQGENEVTDVLFDISSWITEFGEGVAQLRVKRPGNSEEESYVLSLTITDGIAVWTVSETDTANKGNGKVQLSYMVGNIVKKAVIYPYKVGKSIVGADNPVDPFDSWIERSKAWAIGKTLDGDNVPETDETYQNNAKYYAEQADILGSAQVVLAAEKVTLAAEQVTLATEKADAAAASEAAVNGVSTQLTTRMSAIETEQAVQDARMDTFTSLPEGSTSGNAELADIRVGADGTTYDTAGNAVRGQISGLKSDLDNVNSDLDSFIDKPNNKVIPKYDSVSHSNVDVGSVIADSINNTISITGNNVNQTIQLKFDVEEGKKYNVSFKSNVTLRPNYSWIYQYPISESTVDRVVELVADNNVYTATFIATMTGTYHIAFGLAYDMESCIISKISIIDLSIDTTPIIKHNTLPIATPQNKGAVCVGDGLKISGDGTLSLSEKYEIPSYWGTEVNDCIERIKNKDRIIKDKGCGFFFVTDVHWKYNAKNSNNIMSHIASKIGNNLIVNGGDIVYSHTETQDSAIEELCTYFDDLKEYGKAYGVDWNVIATIGNHDYNSNNNSDNPNAHLTKEDLYPYMIRQAEKFATTNGSVCTVYDNKSQKVRFIQFLHDDIESVPSELFELVDSKITELDSNWTVVLFCHSYFITYSVLPYEIPNQNKEIAQHFGNLACAATIACLITGHSHIDESDSENGMLVICTTCDNHTLLVDSSITRTKGTDTEQAFDYVQIDTANRKIYCTRIGAGNDREFSY